MWVLNEQFKNTVTHSLSVEDVSIEWAVKKHDDAQTKSQKDVSLNTTICYNVSENLHFRKYGCYE